MPSRTGCPTIRVIALNKGNRACLICHLAEGAKRISKEIFGGCIHLRDSTKLISLSICSIIQHPGRDYNITIQFLVGGDPIHGLAESAAKSVVVITAHGRLVTDRDQPIGRIVGIRIHAVTEHVAVDVKSLVHSVHAGKAIRLHRILAKGQGTN